MATHITHPVETREGMAPVADLVRNSTLLKLNRIFCILSAGAVMAILVGLYIDLSYPEDPGVGHVDVLFHVLVLILLAGGIFCGFLIAKQAKASTRKSEELLLEARQRTTELEALYDTSQDISGQHGLSSLLHIIVGRAKTLLDASGCALFLYDEENDDFEIAFEVGGSLPVGTHLPLDSGLAGHVAKSLKPVIVNDYPNWPSRSKELKQLPLSAAICVPMIRGGELIGVLGVHENDDAHRKFTADEARLLSLFADNAAGAVFNTRLMEALQSSKERFRIAAECASDIVYDWDLATDRVEYFGAGSKRARARAAMMPSTRKEFWDIVHPADRERIQESLASHLKEGKHFAADYRIMDESGAYIVISDRATAIRNPQGVPVRLIGAVSNITARKQAEQMKSDFVSFVTHQLRTPLSGVKWMLELAMDSMGESDDVKSFVQDAQTSTERLIGLVNDLLDLSRLERGKLQIDFRDIEIEALTQGVVEEMQPLIHEKEQSLSLQVAGSFPAVPADPQLLRQVILNLTSNAMKYTANSGEMKIRLDYDDSFVYWEIEDNGIGIPSADQRMLFEKFYRAGNAIAVETEGTGLGLYLVRLIVERLGGRIACESQEGIGSIFKFSLPRVSMRGTDGQRSSSVN